MPCLYDQHVADVECNGKRIDVCWHEEGRLNHIVVYAFLPVCRPHRCMLLRMLYLFKNISLPDCSIGFFVFYAFDGHILLDRETIVLYYHIHEFMLEDSVFDFSSIVGFDWDEGNKQKNWEKHRVDFRECEEVFFNRPLIIGEDRTHSTYEKRYYALGRSDAGRPLFLAFTIRDNMIRVISAREQTDQERQKYARQQ